MEAYKDIELIAHQPISSFALYTGLVLVIWVALLFIIKLCGLEKLLMERFYGASYTSLTDERKRRKCVIHHITALTKILLVLLCAGPFFLMHSGKATIETTVGNVNLGDCLFVLSQLYVAIYIFELFMRMDVSLLSSLHYIAAITITKIVLASDDNSGKQDGIVLELTICLI